MADFADRSLGIGYPGGASLLFVLLMASLADLVLVGRIDLGQHGLDAPDRDLLLGRDPVLADARHRARRLDGRHQRARL